MLSFFRRGFMSKVMLGILFLALVAIVITGFGTGGMGGLESLAGGGMSASTVAKVGGETISSEELRGEVQRELDAARQQQPDLDMAQFIARGGLEAVLDRMINAAVMRDFAASVGIVASKKMVDAQIAGVPQFQNAAGKFDDAVFQAALQRAHLSEAQLRNQIATSLIAHQLLGRQDSWSWVPQGLAFRYASLMLENRSGVVGSVPASAMGGGNEPTDQEVADYYKKNIGRYTTPERRVIRYALFGADTLGAAAKPTDAEIQQAYTRAAAAFAPRETRILSQVVLQDEGKARAFAQKVASGTAFAQAAQQEGRSAADIALGAKSKDELARLSSPAVANAVFAAAKGATVGPVRDPLGWHIVKVEDVKTIPGKSLAEARGEIATQLEAEKTQQLLGEIGKRIEDKINDGASFDQVVRDEKLAAVETPALTGQGAAPDAPGWKAPPELGAILKGASTMAANEPPQVAPVAPNQRYAVVSVSRVVPAAPPPFAQVQAQVKADLVAQRASERAEAVAQSIVSAINAGTPPADAFRQAKVALPALQSLSATRKDVAQSGQMSPQLQLLFTMGQHKARKIPAPGNNGWLVVFLDKIVPGDASNDPQLTRGIRGELVPVMREEHAQQLVGAMRSRLTVRRNEQAIAALRNELLGRVAR